jgi:hypothetical protein
LISIYFSKTRNDISEISFLVSFCGMSPAIRPSIISGVPTTQEIACALAILGLIDWTAPG